MVSFHARVVVLLMAGASIIAGAASGARGLEQAPAGTAPPSSGAPPAAAGTAGETKGNATNGKTLYKKYGCYECHGYVGQGGGGPRLAPEPMALAVFTKIVRHPPNQMPPYTA